MKDYIISLAYANVEDEWEMEQLQHKSNQILLKEDAKDIDFAEFDRNFYSLCSLMEENGSTNPQDYSVIQFYSKLDYINKKIEKQNEAVGGE